MPTETRWYAAYTKSRHEARVAEHLAARDVEFFLAQYKQISRWKDREVELRLPLFPGYIFVHMPVEERLRVLEAPGVIYLVSFGGTPEPVPDPEIAQLKASVDEALDPKPHPFIEAGDRVIVTRGPLEGTQGILVRDKGHDRVVLTLDLIQRSMSIEVDSDAIMPVQPGPKPIQRPLIEYKARVSA